ncbi:MAG: cysteine desulfurase, partial [Anaerolineales bacterium]|nr:cysteine desulfurase [Anaerolineales bacterium]
AKPSEIIFTSCGSESDNMAIRGTAFAARQKTSANHLLISPIEHPAVLNTANQLADLHGFDLSLLPVDKYGMVSPAEVKKNLREDTFLVSVMQANNEIGTINPIAEIGDICRERGILLHTDAVQSGAHFPLDVNSIKVDLLSLGAHKFYGPKGVGALFIRSGTELSPILTGGSQEFGLRAATQNIPLIVGMAAAFELVQTEHNERTNHILPLRDHLIKQVLKIPSSQLTGHPEERQVNHASFVFEGVDGNLLISILDGAGFACSSGSACKTGDPEPSLVLTHLGYSTSWALGSLRVTLGKDTTAEDIDSFLKILPGCIHQVRELKS